MILLAGTGEGQQPGVIVSTEGNGRKQRRFFAPERRFAGLGESKEQKHFSFMQHQDLDSR